MDEVSQSNSGIEKIELPATILAKMTIRPAIKPASTNETDDKVQQNKVEEPDFIQQIIDSKRTVRNLESELEFNPTASNTGFESDTPDLDVDDLLAEHFAMDTEDSAKAEPTEIEIDDSLAIFLAATESPVALMPTNEQPEEIEYPYLYTDRLTPMEVSFYKQSKLLLEPDQDTTGSMQLYLRLPNDLIRLGRVVPGLKTFLTIKRICNTRKIFIALDPSTSSELDDSDLNVFLLEDFE